jgi:lysophospholipase L1-like esterase
VPTSLRRAACPAALVALTAAVVVSLGHPEHAHANNRSVLVVGDSLAVGMKPFLGTMLPGRPVAWDAVTGRTTPVGLRRLRIDLRTMTPRTVVISLGTNDGPDPARFADRLRRVMRAVPSDACVVWASINRPPRKGPYVALNRVLDRDAQRDPRLAIVDWNAAVRAGRVYLPDGLHPDAAGFRYRASLIAAAVRRGCWYPLASR